MKISRIILMFTCLMGAGFFSACGGGGGTSQNQSAPVISSVIGDLQAAILSMNTMSNASPAYDSVSGIDYSFTFLGFSFCTPSNLYMNPDAGLLSGTTSVYGCTNAFTVDYTVPDPTKITITMSIPEFYIDFSGTYYISALLSGGSYNGYLTATDIVATATINVISNGDGTYRLDDSTIPGVVITAGTIVIETDDPWINTAITLGTFYPGFNNMIINQVENQMAQNIQGMISTIGNFIY